MNLWQQHKDTHNIQLYFYILLAKRYQLLQITSVFENFWISRFEVLLNFLNQSLKVTCVSSSPPVATWTSFQLFFHYLSLSTVYLNFQLFNIVIASVSVAKVFSPVLSLSFSCIRYCIIFFFQLSDDFVDFCFFFFSEGQENSLGCASASDPGSSVESTSFDVRCAISILMSVPDSSLSTLFSNFSTNPAVSFPSGIWEILMLRFILF